MILTIHNTPNNISIETIHEAAHWYGKTLLSSRMYKKITLNIIFNRQLKKKTGCIGFCSWVDNNKRPKEFEIEIDALMSHKNTLKALAHEMVHLKQYATSQMIDLHSKQLTKWEGKLHVDDVNFDKEYWFSPWEIEAYGRENGLYVLFLKYLKENRA